KDTELEAIKNEVNHDRLMLDNRIVVSGTSMGGITTASLLKQDDWINTGLVLMGSPNLVDFCNLLNKDFNKTAKNQISLNEKEKVLNQLKPFDLSKDMASLNNRPI